MPRMSSKLARMDPRRDACTIRISFWGDKDELDGVGTTRVESSEHTLTSAML